MGKRIIVDAESCTGCRTCEVACSVSKSGASNPARSRVSVISWADRGVSLPILCTQCAQAPCMACCPVDALSRNPRTGAVERVEGLCIGCTMCVSACPFGAMSTDPGDDLAVNCDLCQGDPACVAACPYNALIYAEASQAALSKRRSAAIRILDTLTE